MPNGAPKVSITITNYNYAQLIGRAIASVQKQTLSDFEIVVVDNASTDDSVQVVERLARQDPRIRLLTNPENIGLSRSLKRCGDESRGTYRVHLDADDWIVDPQALERQVELLDRDPDISFVFSPVVLAEHEGEAVVVTRPFTEDTVVPGEIAMRAAVLIQIVNSGPMMRMSAFRSFGGYNLDYMHAIDIKLAIDLCGAGKVGYIDRPLYAFFQHQGSMGHVSRVAALQADMVKAIESGFTGPVGARIPDARRLRRRALSNAMTLHATQLIFNDHYREGWQVLWDSVRREPQSTLTPKPIASLVTRTLLGAEGFRQLQRAVARFGT